jgi:hypothetical protein
VSNSEARFTVNVKEGFVELEGKESFVDRHLEKFEEIFKMAVREAITRGLQQNIVLKAQPAQTTLPQELQQEALIAIAQQTPVHLQPKGGNGKHTQRQTVTIHPIPVDLKANESKVGLREFYGEKKPANHYEKATIFVYYLTKFNKQQEVKFGEILSCYEEVSEKKPSILDIMKNSVRYKGWLEQGSEKYATRLTISGENFVKFDLPAQRGKIAQATLR